MSGGVSRKTLGSGGPLELEGPQRCAGSNPVLSASQIGNSDSQSRNARGCSSVVERRVANAQVVGSNPITRLVLLGEDETTQWYRSQLELANHEEGPETLDDYLYVLAVALDEYCFENVITRSLTILRKQSFLRIVETDSDYGGWEPIHTYQSSF